MAADVREAPEGPLRGWYEIHEALRHETVRLCAEATKVRSDDAVALADLSEDVQFFMDVLVTHAHAEDGIMFPILAQAGVDVPKRLFEDHHDEILRIYDVQNALLEVRYADDAGDSSDALERMRSGLAEIQSELGAHLDREEESLVPHTLEIFDLDEQANFIRKIISDMPAWLAPKMLPWIMKSISPDHRVEMLGDLRMANSRANFEKLVDLFRDGVEPEVWAPLEALVSQEPE